ncbi:thioredoxin-disulfide reductase [Candidatus Uhrbacteria bacterium CG10_big_fil_rev_8_21_14_0_10_48_11]|uniref:Thioredoxin reductase n=1 Tax=Candidatus Uhrbacteria bacterium CG10_big_fil_rev_8_21_14_0_10_48_11 TaxID=1975037 RepID=A0A2M8LDZ9_9BACT|nr:MAG: thioredoxin-disulfide reductase [Candidatus Uhrbacteria bacterium CG10_big_fil_rev_8_21_14_0_10_48_11]
MNKRNLIIIGSGPAGLTAAIYASRASLSPLVISGPEPGGQLTLTSEVEDYPGFPEGVLGQDLMEKMRAQAERFGAEFLSASVASINVANRPFTMMAGSTEYSARSIIVATGASARWLDLPSEQRLIGKGVSSCAVCDGYFFKGKDVAIVGGGDSAAKEALYLAKLASHVTLIHRRTELRAQKILQDRLRSAENITLKLGWAVEEVLGEMVVSGLRLAPAEAGDAEKLAVAGLFVAIGHIPNTKPFVGSLALDDQGYIESKDGVHTSVEGVFVAGDVHDRTYRQAVTAAGMGCKAAMQAEEYLEEVAA